MEVTIQKVTQKDGPLIIGPERLEVVRGPTGRRRWTAARKAQMVAESFGDDVTVSEVARRHDARPNQLFLWRRQAREGKLVLPAEDMDMGFAPIVVEPEPMSSRMIEIAVDGVVIRVCPATAATRIAEIACAVRRSR